MEVGEEVVAAVGVDEAEGVHHELGHRTRRSCYAFPNQQKAFQKKRFQNKQFLESNPYRDNFELKYFYVAFF